MLVKSKVSQFQEIFKKFLGVFVLMILFAIAELAPDTNAEEVNPLVGKWVGRTQNSNIEHVLRLEGDRSFTWDSNGKLLMSGTWAEDQNTLDLKFGNDEGDSIRYQMQLQDQNLNLKNDEADYSFSHRRVD